MEEAVADIAKAFTEGLNALGFNVTESNKNLNFATRIQFCKKQFANRA